MSSHWPCVPVDHADIVRRLNAIRRGVVEYESLHAILHPVSCDLPVEPEGCPGKTLGSTVDLVDALPLRAVTASIMGDHHRISSGTANAPEFRYLHRLLQKHQLGAVAKIKLTRHVTLAFLTPLQCGFDMALLRTRGRDRHRLPPFAEPHVIKMRVAKSLIDLLAARDAAECCPRCGRGAVHLRAESGR